MNFRRQSRNFNRINFEFITSGDGPILLLFLHGFPDHAGSLKPLMNQFSESKYKLVAPYMRGYGPTGSAPDGRYQVRSLAMDVTAIIEQYSSQESWIIGHDWGAMTAYAAASVEPDSLRGIVPISVPPLKVFLKNSLKNPSQFLRSWYILFFQIPFLPERLLKARDFYLLEWFWSNWSPNWNFDKEQLQALKKVFSIEGTPEHALRYYRTILWDLFFYPEEHRLNREILFSKISLPSFVLTGEEDGCIRPELFEDLENEFTDRFRFNIIPESGHFLPQECPKILADRIKRFLRA